MKLGKEKNIIILSFLILVHLHVTQGYKRRLSHFIMTQILSLTGTIASKDLIKTLS